MTVEAIFLGYRRDDTADVAGRIYDAMTQRFGKQRVFKDVDSIGPGVDFGDYIKTVLPRCRVALILIGPHWLASADEAGKRRLDDQHDWVRVEIETALATPGLLVVPVLVNGARMPRLDEIPDSLKHLLRKNAAIIRRDPDFHDDVDRLATAIRTSINTGTLDLSKIGGGSEPAGSGPRPRNARLPILTLAALTLTLGLGAAAYFWWEGLDQSNVPSASLSPAQAESPRQSSPSVQAVPELPEMVRIPNQPFEVGRHEVTFAQWDVCVDAGGCNGYRPVDKDKGRGNYPVVNVSWNDAQAYVQWISERTGQHYRLLTSSEWEVAARAGSATRYSWGDQDPICYQSARNGANFVQCEDDGPRPVGSFQPNAYGLFDMHGNVFEWVQDCFQTSCTSRELRGGAWYSEPGQLRSVHRGWGVPGDRDGDHGFRVARSM